MKKSISVAFVALSAANIVTGAHAEISDEAARICRRVAGISVPATTRKEIIGAGYSAETAMKFIDCVVNYQTPVDAKEVEELDRRIGARRK
jgi:hypothetical protein